MKKIIYLDHSATTPVDERVLNKMIPYFNISYGNPSSIYSIGRRNKLAIEKAREEIGEIINAKSNEIYFTSCGSESDNLALKGIAYANNGKHIITSKIEHPAILNTCKTLEKQGYRITYLNVDGKGIVDLEQLENAINSETILISIMFANNEIGTIEPIEKIGKIARDKKVFFHTDAVQAMGNIKINVKELGIDLLSMSAHKFYGPKGVGALYVRSGIKFETIQNGGHQEKGKRAGTENVAGIIGMAEALKYVYKEFDKHNQKILKLRNYFIELLKKEIKSIRINGDLKKRLPGNINVSFEKCDGQQLLLDLDEYGICASSGSACSAGNTTPSHVLTSIGLDAKTASGTLRFSLGKENTEEEIRETIRKLKKSLNE